MTESVRCVLLEVIRGVSKLLKQVNGVLIGNLSNEP